MNLGGLRRYPLTIDQQEDQALYEFFQMEQIRSLKDDQDLNDLRIKQEKLAMEMLRRSQKIAELIQVLDHEIDSLQGDDQNDKHDD